MKTTIMEETSNLYRYTLRIVKYIWRKVKYRYRFIILNLLFCVWYKIKIEENNILHTLCDNMYRVISYRYHLVFNIFKSKIIFISYKIEIPRKILTTLALLPPSLLFSSSLQKNAPAEYNSQSYREPIISVSRHRPTIDNNTTTIL